MFKSLSFKNDNFVQKAFYLYLVSLSSLFHPLQCQILGLQLQTSSMPIDGEAWATYYQSTQNKIWLLSPRIWNTGSRTYNYDIITYDIDTNMFETLPDIPNPVQSMNAWVPRYSVAIGDDIYFNGETSHVYTYNINTATSTYIHSIGFSQSCLATDGRFLFIIGGERVDSPSGVLDTRAYDTSTGQWYVGKYQLYAPRRKPCELINGILYAFGGDNAIPVDYITKLNVGSGDDVINNWINNNWENAGNLVIARRYHNTAVCESLSPDLVYIIGGSDFNAKILEVEIYDTSTEISELAPFSLNEPRQNPAVMCIDSYIYIFGGLKFAGATSDSWEKSILTESPTNIPTKEPSVEPSIEPTAETDEPTNNPSFIPTNTPSFTPSDNPSNAPSLLPTESPSKHPSIQPINAVLPSISSKSTSVPSEHVSSTSFISTQIMDKVIKYAPQKVDILLVILVIIIVITSIVIIMCLCYFIISIFGTPKIRKHTVANMGDMMDAERNEDDAGATNNNVTGLKGVSERNNIQFISECHVEDFDDDDILEDFEVNQTKGETIIKTDDDNEGECIDDDDDDEIMQAIQETVGNDEVVGCAMGANGNIKR